MLKKFKPDGKTLVTRDDVWVDQRRRFRQPGAGLWRAEGLLKLGHYIGPEYAFGYFMGEAPENQVLLIKYAPGGQSLYQNFRPPSAGLPDPMPLKTVPRQETKVPMTAEDFGGQYRGMVEYVHDVLEESQDAVSLLR